MWLNMSSQEKEEDNIKKISALNEVFEDVISDASGLIKYLAWSVKTYLLFGLILILFGISELAYNAEFLQERYYAPLFIAGTLIFAGTVQIYSYFKLRKKYSRLFGVQEKLDKM